MKRRTLRRRSSSSSQSTRARRKQAGKLVRRRAELKFEQLEPRQLLAAQFLITEFMASNTGTILDEDGDTSDWIELYNAGDQVGSLQGYYLTDDQLALDKWAIPDVELAPREYLLLWASGKDRVNPLLPLHTNFKIAVEGEFVGLVAPDGQTVVASFDAAAQVADVSQGLAPQTTTDWLIDTVSLSNVLVPGDANLGGSWTSPAFVAGPEWTQVAGNGVGFDLDDEYNTWIQRDLQTDMYNVNATAYTRYPFSLSAPYFDSIQLHVRYEDGMVVYLNGNQVLKRNAPTVPAWNSSATQSRPDSTAISSEVIDMSLAGGLLRAGENVLAIHGMNVSSADSDFLIAPRLEGTRVTYGATQFFALPSPGRANHLGSGSPTLLIHNVTPSNIEPSNNETVSISAHILEDRVAVSNVQLHYRVMYGGETAIAMYDDGGHGDGAAGDGVFGAFIPASAADPGEMVRYYVTATDTQGSISRYPEFLDPDGSPQYDGLVVSDGTQSELPIYHWYTPDPDWFRNGGGSNNRSYAAASLYYDGVFYDNILVRIRGETSQDFDAPKFKFTFNDGYEFRYDRNQDTVQTMNLEPTWADPSSLRLTLGFEMYREAGGYASLAFPVHTRMNGEFYRLSVFVERINRPFLRRNGLDDDGALYKAAGVFGSNGLLAPGANLGTTSGMDKVNGAEIDPSFADLNALIAGLSTGNSNRGAYLFDHVNLPEVINVMSVYALQKQFDRNCHNYFVYRDTFGSGEWSLIPWDLDTIWDRLSEPIYGRTFTGSPLEGSSSYPSWGAGYWNYLYDAVVDTPVVREMYMRRLRTLMDDILQPPSTPASSRKLEARIDQWASLIDWEAKADYDIWGEINEGAWRTEGRFPAGLSQLKSAIQSRRNYLYNGGFTTPEPANPDIRFGAADVEPSSGNQDQEYIQLVNENSYAVDISGWQLRGGIRHTFAPGTVIPSQGVLYVTPDSAAFRARTEGPTGGQGLYVQGGYEGQLSRFGETVQLVAEGERLVDTFDYDLIVHPLVATEINYHPFPPSPGELAVNPGFVATDFEFIEFTNTDSAPMDTTGMVLSDGASATFSGTLAPGQRGVVVQNVAAFTARYGSGITLLGEFTGGTLDDGGERIEVEDALGNPLLRVTYDDDAPWPHLADGWGTTLELLSGATDYGAAASWRDSGFVGGSPGQSGSARFTDVVINEVLTHTDAPQVDSIELLNTGSSSIDIGGWYLSDSSSDFRKFRIPAGTALNPGQYLVFDENDFNASGGSSAKDFALDSARGDEVWLVGADGNDLLTYFADVVKFGAAANGESLGRWPDSLGPLYPMLEVTLGQTNAGPRPGQLVISEIMYHPANDPTDILEFVEIFNTSGVPVDLTNWRLDGAVEFTFPSGMQLAPYGVVVVVPFDPADPIQAGTLDAFRNAYAIGNEVPLAGGYFGRLNNAGDQLQLLRPDSPPADDPLFIPAILEDEVIYDDAAPWPTSADGLGLSLVRKGLTAWGNDAQQWMATAANPGLANHAPTANDDRYLVARDSTSDTLSVLRNDSAAPDVGETLQIIDISPPDQNGSLSLAQNGTLLVYAPTAGFLGTETFTYRIHDGLGGFADATVTITVQESVSWQNISNPLDVNNDGEIAAIDALQVINDLNRNGSRTLPMPPEPPDAPAPYLDVDGDGVTSPLDALLVINQINRDLSNGEGEGQGTIARRLAGTSFSPLTMTGDGTVDFRDETDILPERKNDESAERLADDWATAIGEASLPEPADRTTGRALHSRFNDAIEELAELLTGENDDGQYPVQRQRQ